MQLENKKVLVIGAGKSGIGACELLTSAKANIHLYDANESLSKETILEKLPRDAKIRISIGSFSEEWIKELDLAIISPGVPTDLDYVLKIEEAGVPIWGELELAYHFEKGKVIAITGTNGKTTTTSLVGHIIRYWTDKVFVVGNIGMPYTESVLRTSEDSITVAEVSSFQLEKTTAFHPAVSAVLNITPDHLNRHHTMQNYREIKESIAKNQTEQETCVLNFDDDELRAFGEKLIERGGAKVVFFSTTVELEHGFYLDGESIMYRDGSKSEELINVNDLNLIGRHNFENVMAAAAMALAADIPINIIRTALPDFHAVAHRIEYVDTVNGVVFYNDSKGTNPDAAIKAIEAMRWPTYLIGGGYDKDADYTDWIRSFRGKVKKFVLIGATREKIDAAAKACGYRDTVLMDTFEEAFSYCAEHAQEGEAVLLSPACASWGMFEDYEKRGDRFKELTAEWKNK